MIGRVVSTKMQKTATVLVSKRKKHSLYKKTFLQTKKYLADDPLGVRDGDVVILEKVRPISKRKHWRIKNVVGKDIVALGTQELKEEAAETIAEFLPEEKEKEDGESRIKSQESDEEKVKTQKAKGKTATKKPKVENKKKGDKTSS